MQLRRLQLLQVLNELPLVVQGCLLLLGERDEVCRISSSRMLQHENFRAR